MSRPGRVVSRSTRAVLCVWGITTIVPTGAAHGQAGRRVIHGTVVDTRDQPVSKVNVTANGGGATVSDDSGRFRLEIAHRDRIVFDARRLGYTPSRFALAAGGDTSVYVLLLPTAQQLAGVNISEVAPKPIQLTGFE